MKLFKPITIRRDEEWLPSEQCYGQPSREWLRGSESRRLLTPVYLFKGIEIAWECSECGKLFSITVDELPAQPTQEVPDHVQTEFRRHSCTLHLVGTALA